MQHKTDGKLHGQIAYSVMRSRLDIDGYRTTYGCFPPGMFSNLDVLDEWIFDMANRPNRAIIEKQTLTGFSCDDVLILTAGGGAPIRYESVWVRAKWGGYRGAMKAHLEKDHAGSDGIASVDADHVINKQRILKNHCDGWVMLMPVPLKSNRAFGSAIEKGLPPIDAATDRRLIEPLLLLKTFAGTAIQNLTDLQTLEAQIAGQMESDDTKDETVRAALSEYKTLRGW